MAGRGDMRGLGELDKLKGNDMSNKYADADKEGMGSTMDKVGVSFHWGAHPSEIFVHKFVSFGF